MSDLSLDEIIEAAHDFIEHKERGNHLVSTSVAKRTVRDVALEVADLYRKETPCDSEGLGQ